MSIQVPRVGDERDRGCGQAREDGPRVLPEQKRCRADAYLHVVALILCILFFYLGRVSEHTQAWEVE